MRKKHLKKKLMHYHNNNVSTTNETSVSFQLFNTSWSVTKYEQGRQINNSWSIFSVQSKYLYSSSTITSFLAWFTSHWKGSSCLPPSSPQTLRDLYASAGSTRKNKVKQQAKQCHKPVYLLYALWFPVTERKKTIWLMILVVNSTNHILWLFSEPVKIQQWK